jgi:hypothetical protein
MRQSPAGRRLALAAVVLGLAAGVVTSTAPAGAAAGRAAAARPAATPAPPPFHRANFQHPLRIDNQFLPFSPGMRYVLDGTVDGAPHRVVLIVTDLVKVIDGVRTAVLLDRDYQDGQLAEAELAFEAQDDAGAVWNLGEYPEVYENGQFTGAPDTWITGVAGTRAGYHMLAQPRTGTPPYVQGSAPSIDFLDIGQVSRTGQHVCVPTGCYDDVLVVDESSPLDPESGHQLKFYAPGVGNIKITPVGDANPESLTLSSRTRLSPVQLAEADAAALLLEARAYVVSAVYRHTPPAQLR